MFVVMSGIACLLRPSLSPHGLLPSAGVRHLPVALLTMRGVLTGLERFGHESAIVVGDRLLVLMLGAYALLQGWGLIGLCLMFVVARHRRRWRAVPRGLSSAV
jgi:hypothetical protein